MDANIQSDDLRQRVQQLELSLCGASMDLGHHAAASAEYGTGSSPGRPGWAHSRLHAGTGLAVLDRLDQLDKQVEGVTRLAHKAQVHSLMASAFLVTADW